MKIEGVETSQALSALVLDKKEKKVKNQENVKNEGSVFVQESEKSSTDKEVKTSNESDKRKQYEKKLNKAEKKSIPALVGIGGLLLAACACLALTVTFPAATTLLCALSVGSCLGAGGIMFKTSKDMKNIDNIKKEENDRRVQVLKDLKTKEVDSGILDETKMAEDLYGKPVVAFKNPNGARAESLKEEFALKMNKLFEKYSTKESPNVTQDEVEQLRNDFDEILDNVQYITSIPHHRNKAGTFYDRVGQGDTKSKRKAFTELIKTFTNKNSDGGAEVTKAELLEIREKMFDIFNVEPKRTTTPS